MEGLEYWGGISLLKAGIVYADAVTTVSPTYAKEILSSEYGMGMEGILARRKGDLHGILNGVDYTLWHPVRDARIPGNYSPEDLSGKGRCKTALIRETGLDPRLEGRPLLGMISRLSTQKGLDLLLKILDDILDMDAGLVILGSGDESLEAALKAAAGARAGRLGLCLGFDEGLAHRIMAGADLLLIPSRYEPCGLTQMYALKYGTVPVVRATGGLDDTIVPFDRTGGEGNGFKFRPYDATAFLLTLKEALEAYRHPDAWRALVLNGMATDFSWDRSARRYLELYQGLAGKRTGGTKGGT
jgi:starch synthase